MESIPSHEKFVQDYKANKVEISIDKSSAGNLVLSEFANKNNKRAHIFWTYLGIIVMWILPIILIIFQNWGYGILSFFAGYIILEASRKSATQFVLLNMLEDERFYNYAVIDKGISFKYDEISNAQTDIK